VTDPIRLQPRPSRALILVDDATLRAQVARVLARSNWVINTAVRSGELPALILLDPLSAARLPVREVTPLAGVVLIAAADEARIGVDAICPAEDDALATIAAEWDPNARIAPALRLAAMFGETAILGALVGLRAQLAAAWTGSADADGAHRLAGITGTLGFADASAAWSAQSEGEPDALPRALHQTRLAMLAIDCAVWTPSS
jgi:hypothetical protein